jgi:hypothetical protein
MLIGRKGQTHNDCIAACIRTLTNDDKIPHFWDGLRSYEDCWEAIRECLKNKGKFLALFVTDEPLEFMQETNPDIPYMLLCSNVVGDHAVICKGDQVIHDPASHYIPITGPHSIGTYIIGVIGDLH